MSQIHLHLLKSKFRHESNEKSLLSFYCELIKPFGNLSGKLDIYNTHLTFRQEEENGEQKKVYKWFLDQIREVKFF